jgi:hypothetical protein
MMHEEPEELEPEYADAGDTLPAAVTVMASTFGRFR